MTKATYISAGIAAALLTVSMPNGSAIAADTCFQNRDGFQWNVCGEKTIRKKKPVAKAAVGPAEAPEVPGPKGIFSTFLPDSVKVEYGAAHPGDGIGGGDGAGDGGGDR